MNKFESYSGCLTWFMALLLSALVAGCGSGGGGGGGGTNPTTTVSGIAASGAPVIGGTVQMVCAGSTPGTAVTTGPDGGFTVTAPLNAPCVIRVSGGTGAIGGPLFSVVASSSQTRANVNQLTHMLAFLLAGGDPDTGLFQSPNSISSKITPTAVATHKATITASVIANLGAAAGIPTSFDFLEGIFTANHTGFDLVLDKIGFTAVGNTVSTVFNGAPLLAVDATTGVASTTSSAVISTTSLAGASTFGAPVTAKAITAYSLAGVTGTINETAKTLAVTMPTGTNVTALVATFTTTGAGAKLGAVAQTSGTTPNDFTNPVAYTVTAADGTTATYTVTVSVALSSAKATTAYSLAGVTGTINETAKTIAVTMPTGTNVTALVATFTTTGAGVKVGAVAQTSGTTPNNFTGPVAYTVTAADNTTATYTVTVTVTAALGPLPVTLGTAGNFVILTKTGITNVHTSAITGNIGASPITAAAMNNVFCPEITGKIFGVDAAYTGNGATTCFAGNPGVPAVVPPDANKTLVDNAVLDMGTAYADAAGRTSPNFTELGAGNISGLTLVPGLYKWGTGVLITGVGVTLSGGPNDVWIFQIAADLTVNNGAIVTLSGGAKPKNIFWQVSGQATLGTTADFKGIILSQTLISLNTGALVNGRLFAQTAVTLQQNAVTQSLP